jgi:hypothetical protein
MPEKQTQTASFVFPANLAAFANRLDFELRRNRRVRLLCCGALTGRAIERDGTSGDLWEGDQHGCG